MNKYEVNRINGGINVLAEGKDGVSGLLFYLPEATITTLTSVSGGAFAESAIAKFSNVEDAEASGVKMDSDDAYIQLLHYQIREAFRMNSALRLYVGIYNKATAHTAYNEVKLMQSYANGDIRQIGIWDGAVKPTSAEVSALQTVATALEDVQQPLCIVFSGDKSVDDIGDLRLAGEKNVSIVVGNDGDNGITLTEPVGIIGLTIGAISKAKVSESISWVEKFPTGISHPQLIDGTPIEDSLQSKLETLDENGLIFLRTYPGIPDSYFSDSKNLDVESSAYNTIQSVRTIDKACRGIYAYLVPKLGAPIYVNNDGTLRGDSIAIIQNEANKPLMEMEKSGELSGYKVFIDPKQNVVDTSTLEVVVKNVAVGTLRTIKVKISSVSKL